MTQKALKLALDALENHTAIKHPQQIHYRDKAITAIKEALAQPEQEPVAWVSEDVCKDQYIDGRPRKIWWECSTGVGTAFYTTPPQRTWVGLTDLQKQVIKFAHSKMGMMIIKYDLDGMLEATEQALREKNT